MTVIPTEKPENASSQEQGSSLEQLSPEKFASRLDERVRSDVEAFQSDIIARLGAAKRAEAELDPQSVEQVRSASGIRELPDVMNQAKALETRTAQSIGEVVGRAPVSDRFKRAVYGESVEAPIHPTPPREKIESVSANKVEAVEVERIEVQKEEHIPMEVFRLERELMLSSAVEKLENGERLEQREVEMIVGAAEGRGWQKLFSKVKAGDELAAFLVPNAAHFSIKQFNDVLFGMQKTDDIIKIRRDILARKSKELGLERVATSYKDEYYRVSKEQLAEKGKDVIEKGLADAAESVRVEMTSELTEMAALEWMTADEKRKESLEKFVQSMLGFKDETDDKFIQYKEQRTLFLSSYQVWQKAVADRAEAMRKRYSLADEDAGAEDAIEAYEHAMELSKATYKLVQQARYGMRAEIVSPILQSDARLGYRMTFGTSEVGAAEPGDYVNVERSVSESLKGAMIARGKKEIGVHFSKEDEVGVVDRVTELRNRIGIQDLTDEQGRVYPIFEVRPDGKGKTIHILNLDLIREIRKGTFKPVSDSRQLAVYHDVKSYIDAINIFDVTKPYVHSEISGEKVYGTERTIEEQIHRTSDLALRLRSGAITEEERKELALLLKQDGKDRMCSSTMEFHRKSLEISNCSYISLDVLDVGPELLQEYELLLQRVANGRMTFDEAQLIAGDATTKKMRHFRAKVTEAYKELCHGDEPIMSVGGDELVLSMDTAKVTDEFILRLRQIKIKRTRWWIRASGKNSDRYGRAHVVNGRGRSANEGAFGSDEACGGGNGGRKRNRKIRSSNPYGNL